MANSITTVSPQQGASVSVVGDTYRILIDGAQTGGAYSVVDMLIPPGGGPGPHAHPDTQEAFYIVEGQIEVKTTEQAYTARPGAYVNIPLNGPVHQFKNTGSGTAHMVCILTPAGMEQMFLEMGKPVEAGQFLPPPAPEEMEGFKAIAEAYRQQLYPPDYLDR